MAPATLRKWSAEALNLALPPLRLATNWGMRIADIAMPKAPVAPAPAPRPPRANKRAAATKTPARKKAPARRPQ